MSRMPPRFAQERMCRVVNHADLPTSFRSRRDKYRVLRQVLADQRGHPPSSSSAAIMARQQRIIGNHIFQLPLVL